MVNTTHRPFYLLAKELHPFYRTGAENLAQTGIQSLDRPVRSKSQYQQPSLCINIHHVFRTGLEVFLLAQVEGKRSVSSPRPLYGGQEAQYSLNSRQGGPLNRYEFLYRKRKTVYCRQARTISGVIQHKDMACHLLASDMNRFRGVDGASITGSGRETSNDVDMTVHAPVQHM